MGKGTILLHLADISKVWYSDRLW